MSYQTGLSGLQAASEDLDVIGQNIANANTSGYKEGTAVFADMYANSIASSINNEIGIGVNMASVQEDFSQGTFETTNEPFNVAINGNGFFQVLQNGTLSYTRDGTFHLSSTGQLVNAQGLQVMGYGANASGIIDTSQTVPLSTAGLSDMAPKSTANIAWSFNLNSQAAPPAVTPFDPTKVSNRSVPCC